MILTAKKIINQIKMPKDKKKIDRASNINRTLVIIGFLVYLYGPSITRFIGGAQGPGVPLPFDQNR